MGNHRFRLSDMIPNAWFYKLRDMNKPRNHNSATATSTKKGLISSVSTATSSSSPSNPKHYHYHYSTATSHSTNSYYYTPRPNQIYNSAPRTTPLPDPPRKSSRRKRKSIYKPSPPPPPKPESTHPDPAPDHSSNESTQSLTCKISSSSTDIIIDVTGKLYETESKFKGHFGFVSDINIDLPPIITKPKPNSDAPARKSLSGMRVRGNSPRVVSKKIQRAAGGGGGGGGGHYCNKSSSKSKTPSASMAAQQQQQQQKTTAKKKKNKSFSESLAIVKSSFDPQKDFRESMVEMIVENNIRASKDLEELLACYLSLNSDEYHDLIVKAFEQIWFSLPDF